MLVALHYGSFDFTLGWTFGLKAFIAAILGGIGNIPGAMLGGILLGVVESMGAVYLGSQWKDVIAYVLAGADPDRSSDRHPGRTCGGEAVSALASGGSVAHLSQRTTALRRIKPLYWALAQPGGRRLAAAAPGRLLSLGALDDRHLRAARPGPQHHRRLCGPVPARPCRLLRDRRLHCRLAQPQTRRPACSWTMPIAIIVSRAWPGLSSAGRSCTCAATIWRSSPSRSARSSACCW